MHVYCVGIEDGFIQKARQTVVVAFFGKCMHALHQSFHFQKFQGAQILIFLCKNWHGASFYIKEQTKKYKFEI